jgi:hypothetical protein
MKNIKRKSHEVRKAAWSLLAIAECGVIIWRLWS